MRINYEELEKLAKLKEQWILTNQEFEIEKKKILNSEEKTESLDQRNISQEENIIPNNFGVDYINKHLLYLFDPRKRCNRVGFIIPYVFLFLSHIPPSIIKIHIPDIIGFSILIVGIIFAIKRTHDINLPWYLFFWLWLILPGISNFVYFFDKDLLEWFISIALFTILLILPWTIWDNEYWPEPK